MDAVVAAPIATALGVPLNYLSKTAFQRTSANRTTSLFWSITIDYPLINRVQWPAIGITSVALKAVNRWVPATMTADQTSAASMPLEGSFRLRLNGVTSTQAITLPPLGVNRGLGVTDVRTALQQLPGITEVEVSDQNIM